MSKVTNIALTESRNDPAEFLEKIVVQGDLSKLAPKERLSYYKAVCESLGLNPLTRPFEYIFLNGRLTLYARKDATDQLRRIHGISIIITSREVSNNDRTYTVTARARTKDGREDEEDGIVYIGNLKGEALANAKLKAITKAKRRVTLSILGLGMLDESEVDSIPDARVIDTQEEIGPIPVSEETQKVLEPTPVSEEKITADAQIDDGTFIVVKKEEGSSTKGTPYVKVFMRSKGKGEVVIGYAKENHIEWAKKLRNEEKIDVELKHIFGSAYEITAVRETVTV